MNTHTRPLAVLCKEKQVPTSLGEITVHELTWSDTFELLKLVASHASKLIVDGKLHVDIGRLGDLIIQTQELADFVIAHAATITPSIVQTRAVVIPEGKTLQQMLTFSDALSILDAALEINLSPEILDQAKNVGARFTRALNLKVGATVTRTAPMETNHSQPPSTS